MGQKSEYEFYERIKDWNFDEFQIVSEKINNWDMYDILKDVTNEESRILDLGTGGGEKVLECFPSNVKEIIATDFSSAMIETANQNLRKSNRKNITFRLMDNLKMNLPVNYFDVVVARNTVTNPVQIYKSLKPGGYLIIRGVDMYDCHELKRIFGKGQAYHDKKPISIIDYEAVLDAGFEDVELVPLHEREYFKDKNSLYQFLLKVPIIDDFSEEERDHKEYYQKGIDMDKLEKYIVRNTYKQGIRLLRRYYGITARKG
ncbi:MAG: class I SAM-dependent methyltransferase [Clostridia bacterium]|nr:class I SAM-dependent methyltransferase [Clostridia bacterium]